MKISTNVSKNRKKRYAGKKAPRNTLTDEILEQFCNSTKKKNRKRKKHKKQNSRDEKKSEAEILTFQSQALEIEPLGPAFDPTIRPTNGKEFLMQMLYERERCPAIVQCHTLAIPGFHESIHNVPDNNEPIIVPDISPTKCEDSLHKKTPEWMNAQTCTFLQARSKITVLRLKMINKDTAHKSILADSEIEMLNICRTNLPVLSIMLRFGQFQLEKLLEWLSEWLYHIIDNTKSNSEDCVSDDNAEKVNNFKIELNMSGAPEETQQAHELSNLQERDMEWLGPWIYATFTCLQLPLVPHVHSTLREIARSCIFLRNLLISGKEKYSPLPYNLFIVLIIFVFRQHDFKEYI